MALKRRGKDALFVVVGGFENLCVCVESLVEEEKGEED
jgi:hypothetical protein